MNKAKKIILAVTGALTLIITAVMNVALLPAIEKGTSGMRFFDMNTLGYSFDSCCQFLDSLSSEGKAVALHAQLPLDFVYPVIYTVFFILLLTALTKKTNALVILPAALFVSDIIENVCSIIMLNADTLSRPLASFASCVTVVKNALMYIIFIIIIVLAVRLLINRRKAKKA